MNRAHLVLVPGFGGFDALGQMRYYTGVASRFSRWATHHRASSIELHFFDNLPTAAVATRARDLENYLDQCIDRHAIRHGDDIVLLGHSTGGLDIRCLLARRLDLRARVKRLVFMSVPHHGTNIADFVDHAHGIVAMLLFGLRRFPWIAGKAISLMKMLGTFDDSQIVVDAIDDLRRELEIPHDGWLAAEARRAAAELSLWREQTASDFLAIQDLKTRPGRIDDELPDLDCLSFATIAPNPFEQPLDHDPIIREFADAWSLAREHAARPTETDTIFRLAYAACSAGPFARSCSEVEWLPGFNPASAAEAKSLLGRETARLDVADVVPWHNDSIVNTASMVWPRGQTWLVPGDHADIIGHYHKRPAPPVRAADPHEPPSHARRFEAYNLLRSNSQFAEACFDAIWDRVFAFTCGVANGGELDRLVHSRAFRRWKPYTGV